MVSTLPTPPPLPRRRRSWLSAAARSCASGHMRRRHSSHDSASPGAEASVKAVRSLRAAQRAERLDGRWSGGYFATGAEGLTYAVTSYSCQGQTADRVLIHVDTVLGRKTCSTTAWPTLPFRAVHTTRKSSSITARSWEPLWGMMYRTAAPTRRR
jgi:hypothetical protein